MSTKSPLFSACSRNTMPISKIRGHVDETPCLPANICQQKSPPIEKSSKVAKWLQAAQRFFFDFVDRIVYQFKKIRCTACDHFATLEDLFGGGLFGWHIFCWQAWVFVDMTPDFADRHGVSGACRKQGVFRRHAWSFLHKRLHFVARQCLL